MPRPFRFFAGLIRSPEMLRNTAFFGLLVVAFLVGIPALVWWRNGELDSDLANLSAVFLDLAIVISVSLAILLLLLFIIWMSRSRAGVVILPFDNATAEPKYSGKAISDSLIAELERIRQIHARPYAGIPESWSEGQLPRGSNRRRPGDALVTSSEEDAVNSALKDVGTVGAGETKLSVGQILLTLRRLWPIGAPEAVMSGSIQKYGPLIRIVARMDHGRVYPWWDPAKGDAGASRKEVHAWEVSGRVDDGDIPDLIRDLAFSVARDITPNIAARTWVAFKHYSEALDAYMTALNTDRPEDLEPAIESCQQAVEAQWDYTGPVYLLHELGQLCLQTTGEYVRAERLLNKAIGLRDLEFERAREDRYLELEVLTWPCDLGLALASQDRYVEAAESINRSIDNLESLGTVESDTVAGSDYETTLKNYKGWAYSQLGDTLDVIGKDDDAIEAYRHAIELTPQEPGNYNSVGYLNARKGHNRKALTEFNRAIELYPERAAYHVSLAGHLRKMGRLDQCQLRLKIARQLLTQLPADYDRACLESISGNTDLALNLLQAALSKGLATPGWARRDADFDFIRDDPRFQAITSSSEVNQDTTAQIPGETPDGAAAQPVALAGQAA